jgi:hypothetical protein
VPVLRGAPRAPLLRQRSAAVTAGVGGTLSLTTQPSTTGTSGVALAQQPVVTTSYAIAGVHVTPELQSGTGSLTYTAQVTDASGVATFTDLKIVGVDGAYRLRFVATNWNTVIATADTTLSTAAPSAATTSGTLVSGAVESDIVNGGKTLVITLTNDTWVASGATFNAQRQAIINGIDSAQAEAAGWDAVVKAGLAVTDVVRTSATVVTITLPAFASYSVTANETITTIVPGAAVTGGSPITASPTLTITNESSGGGFATPDICNNLSFENGSGSGGNGWDGMNDGGSQAPHDETPGNPNIWLSRSTTHAFSGTTALKRVLDTGPETSASCYAQFYDPIFSYFGDKSANRIYCRFYFYFDVAVNGTLKFCQFYHTSNDNFGGFFLEGGYLSWVFAEALFNSGTTYLMVPLSGSWNGVPLVGNWHYVEIDLWHNGDTANGGNDYPSVALYLDGIQLTNVNSGVGNPTGGTVWLSNRLNAGRRTYTGDIGQCNIIGVKNANFTVAGNVWVDRFAVSTSRIGA